MPSISPDLRKFVSLTQRLERLLIEVEPTRPELRKLVNELALVRLAVGLENFVSVASYKFGASAAYLDGTAPALTTRSRTIAAAELFLKTGGGTVDAHSVRWLESSAISDTLRLVMPTNERAVVAARAAGQTIAHIRKIRNHVAHSNYTSRQKFQQVVREIYGSKLNHITPGTLLVTPRAGRVPLGIRLIREARIFANTFCGA